MAGNLSVESRLGEIRRKRGLGASNLARRVNVSRQTIHAIEAGTFVPNTEVALRLARELEVPVDELFCLRQPAVAPAESLSADVSSAAAPAEGQPVRICRVGERWVGVPVSAAPYYLPEADGIISRPDRDRADLLIVSGRNFDQSITAVLSRYDLQDEEFHTGWILRKYAEQKRVPNFDALSFAQRRSAVERERVANLLRLQASHKSAAYRQIKKSYQHERPYLHLTLAERQQLAGEVADVIANQGSARLFAECIDKIHFDPVRTGRSVDEQAFEQIVSRFQQFITSTDEPGEDKRFGLIVHDNHQTVAKKHTELMRRFHQQGTPWTKIDRLIETPLFVDSSLTRMVQVADLCAYALRRYLENQENSLFTKIFQRAHRAQNRVVGVRHFTTNTCACEICRAHRQAAQAAGTGPTAAAGGTATA